MNENLKRVLQVMLYSTDEQPSLDEIEKINFKKDGCYRKFHWTEKQEEKFIEFLSDFLKTKWQGISEHKPSNKKERIKVAEEFVSNYSPVYRKLRMDDFMNVVPYEQLKEVMSDGEYKDFMNFMYGSTVPLGGVYRWDLEYWLNK